LGFDKNNAVASKNTVTIQAPAGSQT
jgi:hypothetical protein